MNLLPMLLYLFQALPIKIPEKQFHDWDIIISNFIWAKITDTKTVKKGGWMGFTTPEGQLHRGTDESVS